MHRTAIALLVYLAGAATACGGGANGGGDVGSTPRGQNLSPGERPTSSAGAASGNVTQGMASVQVADDRETEFSAPLVVPTAYAPPPGGFALRWMKASQGAEIAGLACTGLKSADGSVTVDASGRFSASG